MQAEAKEKRQVKRTMLQTIYHAVDWVSVKLNGLCLPILFISASPVLQWMALVATLSTIIYNSVRIYKELKNK